MLVNACTDYPTLFFLELFQYMYIETVKLYRGSQMEPHKQISPHSPQLLWEICQPPQFFIVPGSSDMILVGLASRSALICARSEI